jgi:hypothetical protein
LSLPGARDDPRHVRALCARVWCGPFLGRDGAAQDEAVAEAEAAARALGDPAMLVQALHTRAHHEASGNRLDLADALADEAIACARAAGSDWDAATVLVAKVRAQSTIADVRRNVDRAVLELEAVGNVWSLAQTLVIATYIAMCMGSDRDAREFVTRAEPVVQRLDDPFLSMLLRGNVGLAALLSGDVDAARQAFRRQITLCRELVARPSAAEAFLGLAAVAAVGGDAPRAARLTGAASACSSRQDPVRARLGTDFLEPARARCRPDEWDAAQREGAELDFGDAIAYALEPQGG